MASVVEDRTAPITFEMKGYARWIDERSPDVGPEAYVVSDLHSELAGAIELLEVRAATMLALRLQAVLAVLTAQVALDDNARLVAADCGLSSRNFDYSIQMQLSK